ncbi:rhomboid family intramembrane serine protease [Lactobacillus sp. PV034]|uniref:rhomboid family intramembrane serine protease n=1 Tax=Lactobacillus sp. PV034 TaxID=2594495 RepID=UPI00223F34E2|nr:rhomboid family intramembrane serine protease [Lactobacillus sp. PV034]QNQ80185.1 rhomboid family intramembrane serine protease [Lactobacillus sp. PV034]
METRDNRLPLPYMTIAILTVLVVMYLIETVMGGSTRAAVLMKLGAMNNLAVASHHQFWRLFTAQFLHIGWLHLASNAVMIYYLGQYLEPIIGSWRFLGIYLLSGVGGNLLGFAAGNDYSIAAGASTALFGLLGAVITLYVRNRNVDFMAQLGKMSIALAVINLGLDLFIKDIDILGHIGGLVTGFFLCILIGNKDLQNFKPKMRVIALVILILYTVWSLRSGMVIKY